MIRYFFDIIERPKTEITALCLIIQLYLFRTSIPFFKYPFIILYSILLLYLILFQKRRLINCIKIFIRNYTLIFILFLVFCIALFLTNKIYLLVFKDLINTIILISIFFTLAVLIESKKKLNLLITNFLGVIILFALIISSFGLLQIFGIYEFAIDNSLRIDYNFTLLPIFFGIISIIYFLIHKDLSIYQIIFFNILLVLFTINIALSGSRRGYIILLLICTILIIFSCIPFFIKAKYYIQKTAIVSRYYILALIFFTIGITLYVNSVSCVDKNRVFAFIGTKKITKTRKEIALNIFRYYSFFNEKKNYSEFYNSYFNPDFNQIDPDCGWGFKYGKRIYPLKGDNVEIVSADAIGCLVDSTSFVPKKRKGISAQIASLYSSNKETYKASIFCYVSEDFNGSFVRLLVNWDIIKNKGVGNKPIAYYNLKKKGAWQKLNIEINYLNGDVPIHCVVAKKGAQEILKGFAIIAYPQVEKVKDYDSILSKVNEYKPVELSKTKNIAFISEASILNGFLLNKITNYKMKNDKDPIRKWVDEVISEDTAYYAYKNDLFIDTITNKFSGPRINRWQFAWQIFTIEYNWKEKAFGGGFDFLNWYGFYFLHDKTKSDYPHNPFLHVLLYSGMIGLALYIFLMYKVFYYYIKYRKEYYIFFIFFLITFFFTFFSGGNPFDPPMMGFFVIFPFFIHSIHKKEI